MASNGTEQTSSPEIKFFSCGRMEMDELWQYWLATLAESIPFCLSQQVFTVIIVLAFILHAAGTSLNQKIITLKNSVQIQLHRERLEDQSEREKDVQQWSEWRAEDLTEAMARLQRWHLRLVLFSHEVNHVFGGIMFVLYGMDVVTFTGFVALLVTKPDQAFTVRGTLVYSMALFGAFATVFYVPLVQAHEQVG